MHYCWINFHGDGIIGMIGMRVCGCVRKCCWQISVSVRIIVSAGIRRLF